MAVERIPSATHPSSFSSSQPPAICTTVRLRWSHLRGFDSGLNRTYLVWPSPMMYAESLGTIAIGLFAVSGLLLFPGRIA